MGQGDTDAIDVNGNEVVSLQYEMVSTYDDRGFFIVRKNGLFGSLDARGRELCSIQYEAPEVAVKETLECLNTACASRISFRAVRSRGLPLQEFLRWSQSALY